MLVEGQAGGGLPSRCAWARAAPAPMVRYHDEEWGVPQHGTNQLFEMLSLEGAQAGLSWSTVLSRREAYHRAFSGFRPELIAGWDQGRVEELVLDPGLIRHRGKLSSVLGNARAVCALDRDGRGLDSLLWGVVGETPLQPRYGPGTGPPPTTPESVELSRRLRGAGFTFVGPTIVQALMQACGLTNDHTTDCFRQAQLDRPEPRSAGHRGAHR